MSYRSVKRLLGEQSLERKSHLIFGSFLLILIVGTFWWINSISERVIKDNMKQRAEEFASVVLMRIHYDEFGTVRDKEHEQAEKFAKEILPSDPPYAVLVSDEEKIQPDEQTFMYIKPNRADPGERLILYDLMLKLDERKSTQPLDNKPTLPKENVVDASELVTRQLSPVYYENISASRTFSQSFQFYTPIRFTPTCAECHVQVGPGLLNDAPNTTNGDQGKTLYGDNPPQHFLRVDLPASEFRKGVNRSRASIIALAIASAFISMFAMYVVVRYVVVKPLSHLRSVSDEISKGNTYLRADLQTGDEFQALASSFNKMLRHLVDTQSKLRDVNLDLDAKVDELAQLNLQLYDSNKLKSEFLANMSHELRTPLNSIIGFSEVLQSFDTLNDKQKKFARNIQQSGRVLLEMINEILDLAKIEAGKMQLKPTEFDLEVVIDAHCKMVQSLVDEKNIELLTEVESKLDLIFQDQAKFQQILTNLISNAIKFTPEGGQITVRLQSKGQFFKVQVEDTGVGIADDDLEIIFEKFRQGKSATGESILTREYEGTGLGLSIVKELCILLGGSVKVESELGQGSIFSVLLPINCPVDAQRDGEIAARFNQINRDQNKGSTSIASTTSSTL
ncbi:HAMP domain-containing histidine kinase [bacterium]|jgi:signal transduction histidine kinase|nr:HAMP domain-containing histidine kinase [bacterium]